MKPSGAHTHPGMGGGGGAAVGALAVFLAAALLANALAPAATAAGNAVTGILHVLLLTMVGCLAAGTLAIAAIVAVRLRRRRRVRGTAVLPAYAPPAISTAEQAPVATPHRELPAPREIHLHLHGVTADDAALIGRALRGERQD